MGRNHPRNLIPMAKNKHPKINLGSKPKKLSEIPAKEAKDKVYYPSMHVSGDHSLAAIPHGEFHFKGKAKKISHSIRTDAEGKQHHSVEMEVHHITPTDVEDGAIEGGEDLQPQSPGYTSDSGDKLDSALEKISAKKSK
jgi:hypothetical protein